MEIQFNKINPNHGVIAITIYESDYKASVEKRFRHYAQTIRLKGFRVGAVPVDLIKRMHGRSIIEEEVKKIAATALQDYIQKEDIPIFIEPLLVSAPEADGLSKQGSFVFSYEVGLMVTDPIELGEHIAVSAFEIEQVGPQQVDDFITGLQLVHGQHVELEESNAASVLYGTLEDHQATVSLSIRIVVARIPESLRATWISLCKGDKVAITEEILVNHGFPVLGIGIYDFVRFQRYITSWPASFTVDRIVDITLPPLAIDFFDLVFGEGIVSSEEAFREAIAKIILMDKQLEARYLFHESLREELFKYIKVYLPEDFLKKWLLAHNPEATLEDIENYYNNCAEDLKWEILLGRIIHSNNLAVGQTDILDEAKRIYMHYIKNIARRPEQELLEPSRIQAAAIAFLRGNEGKTYIQLHEQLSRNRAIDFIKKNISVISKVITVEQFDKGISLQ